MNKLILICLFCILPISVNAKPITEEDLGMIKIADLFVKLNKNNSGGVYRIIDKKAGSIIYLLTTGRAGGQPQMSVVPFGMLDEETRIKLR